MFKNAYKIAAAAVALSVLPGAAQAGTATTTTNASFNVVTQCSITGATVDLGTFTVNNTFFDVGQKIGYTYPPVGSERVGTDGYEGIVWGKVNCNNGTPYHLRIGGTSPYDGILIDIAGKTAHLVPFVKTIGGVAVPTTAESWGPAWGEIANQGTLLAVAGVGTGQDQTIRGSAPIYFGMPGLTALDSDKLAQAGSYTDTLTYYLTF